MKYAKGLSRKLTAEEKRLHSCQAATRYRAAHPDKILLYKANPRAKARAAAKMKDRRMARTPDRRASDNEKMRRYGLMKRHGLTMEEYDSMVAAQGGLCALCRRPETSKHRGNGKLHVDHDHLTGEKRGLLCTSCNLSIGCLRDDPEIGERLVPYLRFGFSATYNVRVIN